MTENESDDKRNLGKREKILVSAVVLASILGVVGGAALGVTFLSSNPEQTVPGTAPTTTPVAPLAGTAGNASVSGVSAESFEYLGEYDRTQDRPHWESPSPSATFGRFTFGLYTGGAYSVNVTLLNGGSVMDFHKNGEAHDAAEMDPVMYLKSQGNVGTVLYEPQGQNDSRSIGRALSEAYTLRIEVLRATESNPTMEIDLNEFSGQEVWLGGTANEPHYLISE